MKKILIVALVLLLPLVVNADSVLVEGIYYEIINKGHIANVSSGEHSSDYYKGDIVIPASFEYKGDTYTVVSLNSNAFSGTDITSVVIPNTVTTIESGVFSGCNNLKSVYINSLSAWCKITFNDSWGCNPLSVGADLYLNGEIVTDLVIPDDVTSISDKAFLGSKIQSVLIPRNVQTLGQNCFYGCQNLVSVTLEEGVTTIGDNCFSFCPNLTSINIPNSVTSIGLYAFYGCTGLISFSIPDGVEKIPNYSFYGCSSLTSVIIPSSVTSVGSYAFADCPELIDVYCDALNVPDALSNCFEGSHIEYATLHVPTSSIESYRTTAPWSSIQNIVASDAIVEVDGVYYRLLLQTGKAEVTSNPNKYTGVVDIKKVVSFEGVDYEVKNIAENAFKGCLSLTSVIIPNSITEIKKVAFYGCSGLTSVTIPSSVTSIGERAFYDCSSLTDVTIPNSVTSIGDYTFYNCSSLTSVTIPSSVTSIGKGAVAGCYGLISVTIPSSVTTIGESAFYNCSGLTSITIPNSVTRIEPGTFYDCSGLMSVSIPSSVRSIGSNAFYGCSSLVGVTIPSSVTSIENSTFYECSSLAVVTIPSSVTSIAKYAFVYCHKLKDVYCYAVNVPTTDANAFYGFPISSATLHVPAGSLSSYQTKAPWNGFGYFVALDGETPVMEQCATPNIAFANGRLTFDCETEGVEFVYNVSLTGNQSNSGNEVLLPSLPPTYTVTVYAKKEGYLNSDVATYVVTYQTKTGDANGDGKITIDDAVQIVDIILGQ